MKVAVLVGGLGTRLGVLTRHVPKPMLEVAGKPFLHSVLQSFTGSGFIRFVILAGYRSEMIREYFGDGSRFDMEIEYSIECEPLGTGGALREAAALLDDRFLVTYGDVYRQFDYDRFARVHPRSCLAVYRYLPEMTTIECGNVALDEPEGRVTMFRKGAPQLRLPYVDAGFALLESKALGLLPATGACSLENDLYGPLAAEGYLDAEVVGHDFYDIGNPADLARTRSAFHQ